MTVQGGAGATTTDAGPFHDEHAWCPPSVRTKVASLPLVTASRPAPTRVTTASTTSGSWTRKVPHREADSGETHDDGFEEPADGGSPGRTDPAPARRPPPQHLDTFGAAE